MGTVADILLIKGTDVVTVDPMMTVRDATQCMNHRRIGAVAVVDGIQLIGVFTERDVLTRVVAMDKLPCSTHVAEVMTSEVVTCTVNTDLNDASETMRNRRIRHLPVCDCAGNLLGMISIGDINAYRVAQQDRQIEMLSDYVYGRG